MFKSAKRLFLASVLLLVPTSLRAADLFSITATPTGSPAIVASGKTLVDLVNNVVSSKDQFSSLQNSSFTATLNYAGLKDAITFQQDNSDPQNVTSTINIPSINFSKTFNGTSTEDVKNQIEDFLKKNGSSTVAAFINQVNKLTLVGVTDGNPLATTALMSKEAYTMWGIHKSPIQLDGATSRDSGTESRIDIFAGTSSTDAGDGYYAQLDLATTWRWSDTVSFNLSLPLMYRDVEGSRMYHAGLLGGLPITLVPGKGNNSVTWIVTPSGFIAAAGSIDLVSGGVLWGAHLTSSASYNTGDWTFTLANQFGIYQGVPISYGDYKFDTEVDQKILRNGVGVTKAFGNNFVDANIAYTNFLDDAAVSSYWSPGVGCGFRWGKGNASALRIGYSGDMGHGFDVHGLDAQLIFGW